MPALPGKPSRRKRATPRAKQDREDVWERTFGIMGLEPMSSDKDKIVNMATAGNISSPSPTEPSLAQGSEKKKMMTIFDLPSETQKDIFKYSNTTDLIALSLVSKHFRAIAAERLYRSFHIVFPDEEDPSNDVPIDGLAGGLDTFVTSDYNYAKHLREIILESLSGGDKGERAYRQYTYDVSCGKFMNTLLLLALRKAKALETFKWDIRVELSREVFGALHGIQSLQHLHLRMQAGKSIYQSPPAIHASQTNSASSSMGISLFAPHHNNAPPFIPMPPGFPNSFSMGSKVSSKSHHNSVKYLLPTIKQVPPTLSGFKGLKTLAILDLDTLDYNSEIKTCIRNSCSTLSSLKLSFSDALANKSRKPPPEVVSDDDSDQEDDFGQGVLPPGPPPPGPSISGIADPNGPSKALKALEEKKNQEGFLAKIFGMESAANSKPEAFPNVNSDPETISIAELRKKFLKTLAPVTLKLFSSAKDNENLGPDEAEVLEIIRKFTQISDSVEKDKDGQNAPPGGSVESSTAKATPPSSSASLDGRAEPDALMPGGADEPGLFDEPVIKKKKEKVDSGVSNPDDIDVDEPEGQELAIDSESAILELPTGTAEDAKQVCEIECDPTGSSKDSNALAKQNEVLESHRAIRVTTQEIMNEAEKLKSRIEQLKADLTSGKTAEDYANVELTTVEKAYATYNRRLDEVTRDLQDLGDHVNEITSKTPTTATVENQSSEMRDYVRSTRGLTLMSLAMYLIPIRASVLSRAVDLRVLQSITLLNVGSQIPFWNIMTRENKLSPLPLHKIYTDNVTLPFLAFVSQLDTLTELLLLERTLKARVESTTAKTTVNMDQIRKVILKRHAATLKILSIRNDAGQEWDMNIRTAMLLCQHAKVLEELAVSFGVRTMHTFLQFMSGLTSLRVFHTIKFRTDDTCVWVMHEFRKFTVDNISHNPHMKLEYIALETSIERLVRRVPTAKKDVEGKAKDISSRTSSIKKPFAQLVLGSSGGWPDGTTGLSSALAASGLDSLHLLEESEDEEGAEWGGGISGKVGLKVETMEGVRFCEVTGVRIFEKDVLGAKL